METKIKFPKGFFTQPRPHVSKNEKSKIIVPFKWKKSVINGKQKLEIIGAKNNH